MKMYEINGKKYYQKKLVLAQAKQLQILISNIRFPVDSIESTEQFIGKMLGEFGECIPVIMGIVLIPEGKTIKEKDFLELSEEFENNMDIETALEVLKDFLELIPMSTISEQLSMIADTVKARLPEKMKKMLEKSQVVSEKSTTETIQGIAAVQEVNPQIM